MRDIPNAVCDPLLGLIENFALGVIASRPRDQVIERHGSPYMERWYLARKAMVPSNAPVGRFDDPGALIPSELENLYLHRFLRGDDEDLHDHPWPWATLIVRGGYWEQLGDDRRAWRDAGDVLLRAAAQRHANFDVEPGTITLFATMPKERDWGFHKHDGFVPWHAFRAWKLGPTVVA
jgi:hypothetical protein